MFFSFAYLAVRALLGLLVRSRRGPDVKDIELMILRHELDVLRRQTSRPALRPADRALLAAAACHLPRSASPVLLVTPRTLLRWHRALGYVPVSSSTLETRYPGVYAIGDVATVGVPKAGVFAEGAARVVAASLVAILRGSEPPGAYGGRGSCYVEFGGGRVGRVDIDFLSGPTPTGIFREPSATLVAEKQHFGSSRRARWFGR